MELISVIALIWAVLNIILFFKLWGACNNIKRIADKYDPHTRAQAGEQPQISSEDRNERNKWRGMSR